MAIKHCRLADLLGLLEVRIEQGSKARCLGNLLILDTHIFILYT